MRDERREIKEGEYVAELFGSDGTTSIFIHGFNHSRCDIVEDGL